MDLILGTTCPGKRGLHMHPRRAGYWIGLLRYSLSESEIIRIIMTNVYSYRIISFSGSHSMRIVTKKVLVPSWRNKVDLTLSPYDTVLYQCALEKDLDLWEARDLTEVGEKGLTLRWEHQQAVNKVIQITNISLISGGQKVGFISNNVRSKYW